MQRSASMLSLTVKTSLRLAAAVIFLFMLNRFVGRQVIETLLPLLQSELHWLDDNFNVSKLVLVKHGVDSVILLDVTLARFVVLGSRVIPPDPTDHATVTVLASSILQPMLVGLALIATWPVQRAVQHFWRFAIGLLLLLLLLPLDVPLVLLGKLWELILMANALHHFSLLVAWMDFMQGGGRLALALCAAIVAISLAQRLAPPQMR